MKFDHYSFISNLARKRRQAADGGKSNAQLEVKLRRRISNLRNENFQLREHIKMNAIENIYPPQTQTASKISKVSHAEQEDRNQKLTQANARLITTSVELQVAVDEIKTAKAEMHHLAHYDFLTDLPNRMQLYERIHLAIDWAKRHHTKVALMFMDIDRFKTINDSLGHATGDKLLQSIAQRLKSVIRSTDTVSRLGGDEFVLLFSEFDQMNTLVSKIEKIREVISLTHHIGDMSIDISTSIGVSLYPDDGEDSDTLLLNADSAMYHAKENGRNRFCFFKPEMRKKISSLQAVEKSIYAALRNKEFELFYQAQINLSDGSIAGVEALLRWHHPIDGVLSPVYFIPAAEECGAIISIGRWVLHEACRQAQAWSAAGLPFNIIAVNISAREFDDSDFLNNVCGVLRETGLEPNHLELEITETALMKNMQASTSILHSLRSMGIKISIDDFGTGYSSLSYLKRIPFDTMKIDQSFVNDISISNDDVLVKAIIAIGKNLNHKIIAEGVETAEQLDFLRNNACEAAQGFWLHSPMPGPEFTKVLEQQRISTAHLH
jgi:diguanylate cyclase (GGDEF)-like protein